MLESNVDELSITWTAAGCKSRQLDWSHGGFENTFTLAGGDVKRILRWRPSTRHPLFDDDHVVWSAYDTYHERVVEKKNIVYTRVRRTITHFQNVSPHDWCALSK